MERMKFQDWIDGAINDFEDGATDGKGFRSAIMDIMLKILEPVEALENKRLRKIPCCDNCGENCTSRKGYCESWKAIAEPDARCKHRSRFVELEICPDCRTVLSDLNNIFGLDKPEEADKNTFSKACEGIQQLQEKCSECEGEVIYDGHGEEIPCPSCEKESNMDKQEYMKIIGSICCEISTDKANDCRKQEEDKQ